MTSLLMKFVKKNLKNEPASLKKKRSTPGSPPFDSCNKDDIRRALLKEQGYLCAYCMQRISEETDENGYPVTKIEHYQVQSGDNSLQLNILNMLAVCRGNEGEAKKLQHCDTSRGNQSLTINPMNENCEQLVEYETSGEIFSKNGAVQNDLANVLKLNNQRLVEYRKYAIDAARLAMIGRAGKNKAGTWRKRDLTTEIKRWKSESDGKFEPFCMAAVYYLERKLARLP